MSRARKSSLYFADFGVSREEFRRIGKDTIEYIAEYHENIGKRRVVPAIEPGYLRVRAGY